MNNMIDSNAPGNDKMYVVKYRLCISYRQYTFSTNLEKSFFIVGGNDISDSRLEELAKFKIYEDHKELYNSDFCPDYINIIDIYESEPRSAD